MTPAQPEPRDDNLMERFDREGARRFRARDAVVAIGDRRRRAGRAARAARCARRGRR